LYVDFRAETKAVYSDLANKEIDAQGEVRAAEKVRAMTEDAKDANYFNKKYFEHPNFSVKAGDNAFNFTPRMEESRDEKIVKEKEFYYHYWPGTGKEYWETKEEVEANIWWRFNGIWELKEIFLLSGLMVGVFYWVNWDSKTDISQNNGAREVEMKAVQKRGLVGPATPLNL
jgi:hypothetical protein